MLGVLKELIINVTKSKCSMLFAMMMLIEGCFLSRFET